MTANLEIRTATPADTVAVEALYKDTFPEEDLLALVGRLLAAGDEVLSLVAEQEGVITGHIGFTFCTVDGCPGRVALLAPLAVMPALHGRGIGSSLVRDGFRRLEDAGVGTVLVLGDPGYYARFGFAPEQKITPPYTLPPEWSGAWQSVALGEAESGPEGELSVPALWRDEALWC